MVKHWLNEAMNLLGGNSRYVRYRRGDHVLFVVVLMVFFLLPVLLKWLT